MIFEEFKGTGNAELKLDRKIAESRVFPAVDVNPSGTRKDELLLSPDELAVVHKLRRVLSGLDSQQAIDLLLDRLKKTKNEHRVPDAGREDRTGRDRRLISEKTPRHLAVGSVCGTNRVGIVQRSASKLSRISAVPIWHTERPSPAPVHDLRSAKATRRPSKGTP